MPLFPFMEKKSFRWLLAFLSLEAILVMYVELPRPYLPPSLAESQVSTEEVMRNSTGNSWEGFDEPGKQDLEHQTSSHLSILSAYEDDSPLLGSNQNSTEKNMDLPVDGLQKEFPPENSSVITAENMYQKLKIGQNRRKAKGIPSRVMPISAINAKLQKSHVSYRAVKPQWSAPADMEMLHARSLIKSAEAVRKSQNHQIDTSIYRNYSEFIRSYELMEQTLKIYIYADGERPMFNQPDLTGIYGSEGWFMKLLKKNKHFVTKNAEKAHLFYLPLSSRLLRQTLYVPNSHNNKNLIEYLNSYIHNISAKYPFWNRTSGADHFIVACHDWALGETRWNMKNSIRSLCNADAVKGFKFGKDVSLPQTNVLYPENPQKSIGGKAPNKRDILAFFAGRIHGYLRPILLNYWEKKDPDIKIFGQLKKATREMSYKQYMKSSKYCISARGYESFTPRVVEAIFYECVPVIISDNYVPPFFETLNWETFSVFVLEKDIPNLKKILLSIPEKKYFKMQKRVKQVQRHFLWHSNPEKQDVFHMILHSIWYTRVFQI